MKYKKIIITLCIFVGIVLLFKLYFFVYSLPIKKISEQEFQELVANRGYNADNSNIRIAVNKTPIPYFRDYRPQQHIDRMLSAADRKTIILKDFIVVWVNYFVLTGYEESLETYKIGGDKLIFYIYDKNTANRLGQFNLSLSPYDEGFNREDHIKIKPLYGNIVQVFYPQGYIPSIGYRTYWIAEFTTNELTTLSSSTIYEGQIKHAKKGGFESDLLIFEGGNHLAIIRRPHFSSCDFIVYNCYDVLEVYKIDNNARSAKSISYKKFRGNHDGALYSFNDKTVYYIGGNDYYKYSAE